MVKIGKIGIQTEFGHFEMDVENVVQNNYHAEFEVSGRGTLKVDVKDFEVGLICPFCNGDFKYPMRGLTLTDRLD